MSTYPPSVRRCQHIKVNGTQCGSPALRENKHCFYHAQWTRKTRDIDVETHMERWNITLSLMEDANSIQMGLGEVMRMLVSRTIDFRTAGLLLYALQTASANLKHTSFEPEPTQVVIDPESVERRPLGATAWSKVDGCEYDILEKEDAGKVDPVKAAKDKESEKFMADYMDIFEGMARDPNYLDRPYRDPRSRQEKESAKRLPTSNPSPGIKGESEERVRDQ